MTARATIESVGAASYDERVDADHDQFSDVTDRLTAAIADALAAIEAAADDDAVYERATWLTDILAVAMRASSRQFPGLFEAVSRNVGRTCKHAAPPLRRYAGDLRGRRAGHFPGAAVVKVDR